MNILSSERKEFGKFGGNFSDLSVRISTVNDGMPKETDDRNANIHRFIHTEDQQ